MIGTSHRHHMNGNHLRHQHGLDGIPGLDALHHRNHEAEADLVRPLVVHAAITNCRRMPCIASRSATPNVSAMSCSPSSGSGWSMANPCDKSFIRGAAAALV